MTTATIRELRQNWPAVERRLRENREPIIVTRDGEPVAQLTPPPGKTALKEKFDPAAHRRWIKRVWAGGSPRVSSDAALVRDRAERR